jgi:hypothetical protein
MEGLRGAVEVSNFPLTRVTTRGRTFGSCGPPGVSAPDLTHKHCDTVDRRFKTGSRWTFGAERGQSKLRRAQTAAFMSRTIMLAPRRMRLCALCSLHATLG